MSLTCVVPAVVPSLTHNSVPSLPALAKKSFPLTGVSSEPDNEWTKAVPASVPSVFQSSPPLVKNTDPFIDVK
jgi:hypothetical protein